MNEKEKKIFDMQSESTKRCLSRSPDLDLEWLNRKIPKEAQKLKEDGSVDLNVRKISSKEFLIEETIRSQRGAFFESARANYLMSKTLNPKLLDKIETPHVMPDAEKRERAIEAFMKTGAIDRIKNAFKALFGNLFTEEKKELTYAEASQKKTDEIMRKLDEK